MLKNLADPSILRSEDYSSRKFQIQIWNLMNHLPIGKLDMLWVVQQMLMFLHEIGKYCTWSNLPKTSHGGSQNLKRVCHFSTPIGLCSGCIVVLAISLFISSWIDGSSGFSRSCRSCSTSTQYSLFFGCCCLLLTSNLSRWGVSHWFLQTDSRNETSSDVKLGHFFSDVK